MSDDAGDDKIIDEAHDDIIVVRTGISAGSVGVDIEALDGDPGLLESSKWNYVQTIAVDVPGPHPLQVSRFGIVEISGPPLTHRFGSHVLRIYAHTVDRDRDAVSFDTEECYLIQAWPAPSATSA